MATGKRLTGQENTAAKGKPAPRLPPVGFWSYARQDDELSGGRLSRLRVLLAQELQQQYGREQIKLFQDMSAITHGADWERAIRQAIDESTFFIPIVTPNFLQSEWCSREVLLFLKREQRLRTACPQQAEASRIFPILFIGVEDAEPEDERVLEALQRLQWFDFRRHRHRNFDEPEVREALSELASTMRSLLKTRAGGTASSTQQTVPNQASSNANADAAPAATARISRYRAPEQPGSATGQIRVGDRLNNIFEVKRFIKAGGMGQVFEGTNIRTGERVAIKALLPAMACDPRISEMFQREAMTLTRLNHEALVQYRVFAEEPDLGVLYIVTEYLDGVDLAEGLERADRSPEELTRLIGRLASGLAAAHRLGAVHRDISPDNVMLPGGDIHLAKIIDFGIAKDLAGTLPTIVGDGFAGKLAFVAPEQLGEYEGEIGPWTDVYSLGLVILAVASGRRPDMGGSFADAIRKRRELVDVSAAPAGLQPLLADMLRADPAQRIRSMDEVIARLGQGRRATSLAGQGRNRADALEAGSGTDGDGHVFALPARGARTPVLGLGLLGVIAVAVAVVMLGRGESDSPDPAPVRPVPTAKESPGPGPGSGGSTSTAPASMPSASATTSSQPKAATRPATQNDRQMRPDPAQQRQRPQRQAQAGQPQQAQRGEPPVSAYCREYPNSPMCAPVPAGRTYCEVNPDACRRPDGFR